MEKAKLLGFDSFALLSMEKKVRHGEGEGTGEEGEGLKYIKQLCLKNCA